MRRGIMVSAAERSREHADVGNWLWSLSYTSSYIQYGYQHGSLSTHICRFSRQLSTEVKVQPQHVEGVLPLLEPITDDTVHKLTEPQEIKVTTTKANESK